MTGHLVPTSALPAWEALNRALAGYQPPCASSPDKWFTTSEDDIRRAAARCRRCQVLGACGTYATAAREPAGVWAGVNRERRQPTVRNESETTA